MAHKSPDRVDERREKKTGIRAEQNGLNIATVVSEKMDGLSLKSRGLDSGQASLDAACGGDSSQASLREAGDETSLKLSSLGELLDPASLLSEEHASSANRGNDIDRREAQNKLGIVTQSSSFVPEENANPFVGSSDAAEFLSTWNCSNISAHDSPAQNIQCEINIPPSRQMPRVNNTEIPTGYAERQPSYRTLSTVSSDLSPISCGIGVQLHQHQSPEQHQEHQPPVPQNIFEPFRSYYHNLSIGSADACISSEDNLQNIHVFQHWGTARPVNAQAQIWQNNGSACSGGSAGASGGGRHLSHSSSTSSMKSFIADNCPVKRMSNSILRHVALNLQCKGSTITWKDLVEKYGWDYQRTNLFENRYHHEGIFFSLLKEPEFQDYTLQQLREDLFSLPRKDILSDLNEMIRDHNAVASRRPAGQNQL